MKITYRKSTGEVVMIGQSINNDTLASAVVKKDKKMDEGYKLIYRDGKIEYEDTPTTEKKKQVEEIDKLLGEIAQANTIEDIKPLLTKIIKLNKYA